MVSFEETVNKAIADGVLQGLVVCAEDARGKWSYSKAFGKQSLAEGAKDMQLDTPLQIASMTKLITTIAVLQLVERGKIGLDDDVKQYIPELLQEGVLESVDDKGQATTKPVKNKITLRLLLTHSSGSIYDGYDPRLGQIKKAKGIAPNEGNTLMERGLFPLLYEPGSRWSYGFSIDWAGRVLEKLSGGTLDSWVKENILPPLGIKDMSFYPFAPEKVIKNLPMIAQRKGESGGLVPQPIDFINVGAKDSFGGHGGVISMPEYVKILQSLLANDEKLLEKQTVDMMFQPQLGQGSKQTLNAILDSPLGAWFVGDFPSGQQYDWGLGGILVTEDNQGRRKKGTLIWSGLANCFWFIDREAGLCGVFGTQVMPPGDPLVEEVIKEFEFDMNRKFKASL
ncbi:hypothetical protein ANO11243_074940 [Dothideomycetidae sp. 11243]|nr:hypothetical protein ANO11243_074940 [fungal sp. No.11243]